MHPQANQGRPHLVHITPSFAPGGAQVRTVQIMNHLRDRFRHTVLALDGDSSAGSRLDAGVEVRFRACRASRNPLVMTREVAALLRELQPRLVLTYNWGSMEAALGAALAGAGPLIHTEDGFGIDEAERQKRRRVLFRRFVLRRAWRVVTPSRTLGEVMRRAWKLADECIEYIPNGVDLERFTPGPSRRSGSDELVIGTVGHLRPEKRQETLIEACAALAAQRPLRLLIVGDGPQRAALENRARALRFCERVTFLGHCREIREIYGRMDLFALSSQTEQMPLSVLEAMACGLPVVSTDVGDIRHMVSPPNRQFVVDASRLHQALTQLAGSEELRVTLGQGNRARAVERFGLPQMLERYESLYDHAIQARSDRYAA